MKTIRSPSTTTSKIKPLVSVVLAAYNEGSILDSHLKILWEYMSSLSEKYEWEMILVNDGSTDNTKEIADRFAQQHANFKVLHHKKNRGLGKALQDGFALTTGDYIVTLDIDLSCAPYHIELLLDKIQQKGSKIVVASPNMEGGKMTNIPWHREQLSNWANYFLSLFSDEKISNLTCMVRAYDGTFIRTLNLRSLGMEIMPEIIHKASIMHERIDQIPAHLDWTEQVDPKVNRRSSMKIFHHTIATLLTGFLLRPFLFFILPGLLLLLFSVYPIIWMLVHFFNEFAVVSGDSLLDRSSHALEIAYQLHPHTFLIAFLSLLLSIQLIALGFQSLQSKHYFEELFNLTTKIYRSNYKTAKSRVPNSDKQTFSRE